jgi:hypothetical protein
MSIIAGRASAWVGRIPREYPSSAPARMGRPRQSASTEKTAKAAAGKSLMTWVLPQKTIGEQSHATIVPNAMPGPTRERAT